jgi:hypothetical protein
MNAKSVANTGCWLFIFPLAAYSSALGLSIITRPNYGLPDSAMDSIEPVAFLLRYFTPLAWLGVGGLVFLRRYGFTSTQSLVLAVVVCLSLTTALMAYGIWYFESIDDVFRLSGLVWWLRPFRLIGV